MIASALQLPIELDELRAILKKYGVVSASVFGSYARGEARPDSDIDLLVELADGRSYLDLGGLVYELDEKYAVKADVVLEGTLRKRIKPYVEREKVPITL